tara:strand:- start:22 stop:2583 length:2562 start_codon:yes stop_codon:yes gene_type:complete
MSSLLDFADFGSSFFGSSGRRAKKISRKEYVTENVDFYRQGLDTTGIKVDYERDPDEDEDRKRKVDISQVGMSEGDDELTPTDISSLGSGFESVLSSGSSLAELQNNFIDYNTSLQQSGFKDRSDSPMYKAFGLSTAALPQSAREVKKDLSLKNVLSPKTAVQTIGKFTGLSPATNVLAGFVGGATIKDPLGNPNYRPSHAVMGLAFDMNMSIQSSNIQQSIQAINANNLTGYGGVKSSTGFFGYIGGQLVSRSPNGKTYSGVNAEYGRMAEAFSKGYVPLGYNVSTETGTQSIASRTGAFQGYTEKGTFAFGNQIAASGSMSDVRTTAETYFGKGAGTREDKQVLSALEKVRSQYDFLGRIKDNVKEVVSLSQALAEAASDGDYTKGSDLGDAAGAVGSGQAPAGSAGNLNTIYSGGYEDNSNNDDGGDSGMDSSSDSYSDDGGGGWTAKGGFIGKKNNFAIGGRGDAEPAGFIEGPPEQFSDQTTIADDIPLKVKDGTFVINAPAVEYAGSMGIQKMLSEGYEKAMIRDIGVDKNFRIGKIPNREELDIQISRGEVVVPPHVAKVIGYDRLEKINNRGKREVERRQKAGDQEKVQAGQGFAAKGGNFSTGDSVFTIDKVADSYKERYATPKLARQATMKLAKKMPLADALAILMWGEAKNLGDEGLEGAAHVLINRANAENYPGFGKSIYEELTRTYGKKDKIFEFNAYEPTKFRETIKKFKKDKDTYLRVRNIAEEVMAGARKDFTNNALFFYNPFTSTSDWYKGKVSRKEFKETTRTISPKNKKTLHVYHVPSDFKMDTILGTEKINPKEFTPSTSIPNQIPLPMKRPKEVEDRNDEGGGFMDYLRKLF